MNPALVATQARIERITAALEAEYGLDGWLDIHHVFDAGYDGDTTTEEDGAQTIYPTTAISTPSWRYRACKIRWYLAIALPQTDDELTLVATHEYMHAILAPLTAPHHKSMDGDLEELVAESLTRIIGRARGMQNIH